MLKCGCLNIHLIDFRLICFGVFLFNVKKKDDGPVVLTSSSYGLRVKVLRQIFALNLFDINCILYEVKKFVKKNTVQDNKTTLETTNDTPISWISNKRTQKSIILLSFYF